MVGRGRLEFEEHNFGLDGRGHDARQVIRISEESEYMIHREGYPLFELNLIFHVADCRSMCHNGQAILRSLLNACNV